MEDKIRRWTAPRKATQGLDIIQGQRTVAEASRSFCPVPGESPTDWAAFRLHEGRVARGIRPGSGHATHGAGGPARPGESSASHVNVFQMPGSRLNCRPAATLQSSVVPAAQGGSPTGSDTSPRNRPLMLSLKVLSTGAGSPCAPDAATRAVPPAVSRLVACVTVFRRVDGILSGAGRGGMSGTFRGVWSDGRGTASACTELLLVRPHRSW